ncbi:MAG: LicD family protein [Clostridia bacterium]|nr:LicD family protein [Clostridia bacterium]
MDFPESYFDDEVRDGFFVSGQMKRCWASQLEVLSDFDEFCKRHDLKWFAAYGTLLGAVRHGGFIPWDDDIDIIMLRRDYDKFLMYAENELTGTYSLVNQQHNPGIEISIYCTRLTSKLEGDLAVPLNKFHGFPPITGIDILCLEDFTDNRKEAKEYLSKYKKLTDAAREANNENSIFPQEIREGAIRFLEKNAGKKFDPDKIGYELEQFFDRLHRNSFNNPRSKKVIDYMGVYVGLKRIYSRDIFDDWMLMPFENTHIRVPVRYHEFLGLPFGPDYMMPVKGGSAHAYPFYRKQIENIQGMDTYVKCVWHPYEFWMPDLERKDRSVRDDAKGKSLQFTELLLKIHMMIPRYIELGDMANIEKLLTSCQDVGQNMEQLLTTNYGEDIPAVELVRNYRSELDVIADADPGKTVSDKVPDIDRLNRIIMDLAKELEQIKEKRQVVFIPYKASQWPAMESIWKAAEEDPDCDAYVIPIPYYRKDNLARAGEQIYEGDLFPSHVPVVDFNSYDFENRHPDVIYMVSAYDEISCSDCVYPFFYGFNIKKFTDKLIYVPPFEIEEITPDNGVALEAIRQYVQSPGFVNADYIVTQSENTKERYMTILKEFSGDEFVSYWDNKLLPLGTPLWDIPERKKTDTSLYKKWEEKLLKSDSEEKRLILFQNGADTLYMNPRKEAERIRKILETFESRADSVTLVWMPQPEIAEYIVDMLPEKKIAPYLDLIREYKEKSACILLEGEDAKKDDEILTLCDAYYGNPGPLSHKFMMKDKPVMLFEQKF